MSSVTSLSSDHEKRVTLVKLSRHFSQIEPSYSKLTAVLSQSNTGNTLISGFKKKQTHTTSLVTEVRSGVKRSNV